MTIKKHKVTTAQKQFFELTAKRNKFASIPKDILVSLYRTRFKNSERTEGGIFSYYCKVCAEAGHPLSKAAETNTPTAELPFPPTATYTAMLESKCKTQEETIDRLCNIMQKFIEGVRHDSK